MMFRQILSAFFCAASLFVCAISGGAVSNAAADGYNRGFAALEAGNYEEALYYISLHAANGDPRAQYTMGVMHRKGVAVEQDDREALLWFLAAAEAGHMLGQYAAGLALDQGRGVDRDVANAVHYLREATLNGHAAAPVQLGNIYFNGVDIETDHAKAFFWWTIADRRNAPGVKQNLGRLDGTISRQDRARAADYLSNCATKTLRNCFPRSG